MQYVASRYFTYFIQFLNSVLIAVYLGPFYLGVWGFINLVVQYFTQINFGVSQSFNALGAIHKEDTRYVSKLFGNTLFALTIVSFLSLAFLYFNEKFSFGIGAKYDFSNYVPYVAIVAVLNYFTPAFQNLFRIYGDVLTIAISQSILPFSTFLCLFFFKGEALVDVLLIVMLFSSLISLGLFFFKCPVKIRISLDNELLKSISLKGIHLFLYSSCFYFILLSTKSLISGNYSVQEFGLFTFSFSLGNAILLLFKSFIFLIFPKVINRLAHAESNETLMIIEKSRRDYITTSHLLGHLIILIFPLFISFFPKYTLAISSFNLIVLALIVYTHCFGFQEFFIAKGKDAVLGVISFVALIINIAVALLLVYVVNVPFNLVILSTMVAYFALLILLIYFSNRDLGIKNSFRSIVLRGFPLRFLFPFIISTVLSIYTVHWSVFILPFVCYLVMNYQGILSIRNTISNILNKPTIINI